MKNNIIINKTLFIVILILFVSVTIAPAISGINLIKNIDKIEVQDNSQEKTSLTFYTFDKTKSKECSIDLSNDAVEEIIDLIEDLKYKIVNDPFSEETKSLKFEFVEILDNHGLLTVGMSRDKVFSFLNPFWLRWFDKGTGLMSKSSIFTRVNNVFNGQGVFQRFFLSPDIVDFLGGNPRPGAAASSLFCSIASGGQGIPFPLFLLPRPRGFVVWGGREICGTNVGSLLSGRGFIAAGPQSGVALGFIGVGLTYSAFGSTYYAFIGYSTFAYVNAETINWYTPPNAKPVISDENPVDGAIDVPISLSELSFRISDADGDRMSYSVSTSPNIGSGTGNFKKNGVYKIPVSGLESNTEYIWSISVSDEFDSVEKTFSFTTERIAPVVSDPFPVDGDGWVPVDISELSFRLKDFQGDLMDYSVETSPDIGSSSGNGVGDGIFTVDVSGLDGTTEYSWFVNVTDGVHWTREVFVFKTQPIMVFDPFEEGWLYRKKITVDHDLVDGDLSDFPVLVSVVDGDLGVKAQVDGDDILFMDGSGGANRLFHEIEFFDDSNGELVAWVKIPNINSNADTIFYIYYGNPSCGSQQYPELVWDNNYMSVYHMHDSSSDITDSTINNKDSIAINGNPTFQASGIAGYSIELDGTQDSFVMPEYGIWNDDFTIEAWTEIDFTPSFNHHLINMGGEYKFQPIVVIDYGTYDVIWRWYTDDWRYISFTSAPYPEDWHYYVGTYDINGITQAFFDAESRGTDSNTGKMKSYSGTNLIGANTGPTTSEWDGKVDEIRYSNIVRSPEWIKTSYNTINDYLDFMSFGPEETP